MNPKTKPVAVPVPVALLLTLVFLDRAMAFDEEQGTDANSWGKRGEMEHLVTKTTP